MNHGRDFWKLNNQLRKELRDLNAQGYTGDGFYSKGHKILDGSIIEPRKIESEYKPEFLCGGSWRKTIKRQKIFKTQRKRRFDPVKVGEGIKVGADYSKEVA